MQPVFAPRSGQSVSSLVAIIFRLGVLWLPTVVLLVGCLRNTGSVHQLYWLGTAFQILLCCLLVLNPQTWRQPAGPPVITLYLIALSWLWLVAPVSDEWYTSFARAIMLMVPLVVFALQMLRDSGALAFRRARILAQRLADRKDWPEDLASCRALPEVKALREALQVDATPALALLKHPRLQVRVAALAALEFRKAWRPGQAELILHFAQHAEEPALRAAAVTALGNLDDQVLVETLAEYLRDPAMEVRKAATEALLWDTETRWPWIRHAVRQALSDSAFQNDGALRFDGQLLTPEAVNDLMAWSGEKGCLGVRAALMLGVHFSRALNDRLEPELLADLKQRLADIQTGPALRQELAQILRSNQELDHSLLEQLLDSTNPAPLRLLAAETLLAEGRHVGAMTALRDIARLPNREIALTTADVVQRRLGVDLGLALGQPLPPLHSRQAAEVTRRVMLWAAQQQEPTKANSDSDHWSLAGHPV